MVLKRTFASSYRDELIALAELPGYFLMAVIMVSIATLYVANGKVDDFLG